MNCAHSLHKLIYIHMYILDFTETNFLPFISRKEDRLTRLGLPHRFYEWNRPIPMPVAGLIIFKIFLQLRPLV